MLDWLVEAEVDPVLVLLVLAVLVAVVEAVVDADVVGNPCSRDNKSILNECPADPAVS